MEQPRVKHVFSEYTTTDGRKIQLLCEEGGDTGEVEQIIYAACPFAQWTVWCPKLGTKDCEECPVHKVHYDFLKTTVPIV